MLIQYRVTVPLPSIAGYLGQNNSSFITSTFVGESLVQHYNVKCEFPLYVINLHK